ncbi:MAG: penicillin-binding protein 1A [Gammaproteobacteria bacterium]|nr:penicillin-binding protein 1A [Gammaproteobacteria bacterium]MBU1645363.1 penicillin-binding protein 1A [Gammaproteobacteria bacterium]MBU1972356.1 penicillin-binding protein 1A [Gammaproteobacteria bacterium]
MPAPLRWLFYPLLVLLGLILIALCLAGIVLILAYPQLPSLEVLTDYRPRIPLRVYTSDGHLIGEFGEERRNFVRIQDVPPVMKQAILAAEDERFYQHPGIDSIGILRAAYSNFVSGGKRQGASTITMQVARNFFLSTEKTLTRKLYEVLLAFKIENNLTKDEILQLYINQIYLGQRAYGFAAAAQIYYGKPLAGLSVAEAAMLAGLPKAPSAYNPVANPKRAKLRQMYVLRRMHDLEFLDNTSWKAAQQEVLHVKRDVNDFGVPADYVAEMARQMVVERFPAEAYTHGLRVITTITKADQLAAYASLRRGVLDYDRRHGYRGAEAYADMKGIQSDQDENIEDLLQEHDDAGDLRPALVLAASPREIQAYLRGGEVLKISGDGLKFAARMLDDKAPANKRLRRGAIIRVSKGDKGGWQIVQLPEVEAAFVAASPVDGAIRALVGGFDFGRSKFNHVTQAWRQPGSSFKPFIYSAALEKGYNPASVVADEPVSISAEETGSQVWEPKNYDGKYEGPMSLRTALAKSKNMVSIRLLRAIGTQYAQDYATRFGFDAEKHPPYLTMALGAGSVTPWQQLAGYAVFANGGYRVEPYIVRQILDDRGNVLAEAQPAVAGDENIRAIDGRNAWLMDSMMHDVVRRGTATRAAQALKRADLAGKTGTTNDYVDAWFCGYQPTVVGIAWIGFDQPKRMGNGETGGAAALPIWIGFMEKALAGVPESYMEQPEGLAQVTAHDPSGKGAGREFVYRESIPALPADEPAAPLIPIQAPAPVQDAKPRAVEKPADKKAAEKKNN